MCLQFTRLSEGEALLPLAKATSLFRNWSEDKVACGLRAEQLRERNRLLSEAPNAIRPGGFPNTEQLDKAVSELTLDKPILNEAARGVRAVFGNAPMDRFRPEWAEPLSPARRPIALSSI